MELKICCDASVKLEKMSNVMEVECVVGDYKIDGDTLNGDILIRGNYIKDVLEEYHDFDEIVPFTLVFNEENYLVKEITIQDFTCQEIINQGIECNFNILVNYLVDETNIVIDDDEFSEHIDLIEVEDEENIIAVSDEDIKKEIDQKYDDLLNEILEARSDDNFLEKEENIKVRSNEVELDCRSILNRIPETHVTFKVYYTRNESDIEKIAKNEKLSLDKVYRDNKENDFINKKRIIVR